MESKLVHGPLELEIPADRNMDTTPPTGTLPPAGTVGISFLRQGYMVIANFDPTTFWFFHIASGVWSVTNVTSYSSVVFSWAEGFNGIYHQTADVFIRYGGRGTYSYDLWSFSFSTNQWSALVKTGGPPPNRFEFPAVYMPLRSSMLAFGGVWEGGQDESYSSRLGDLWELKVSAPAAFVHPVSASAAFVHPAFVGRYTGNQYDFMSTGNLTWVNGGIAIQISANGAHQAFPDWNRTINVVYSTATILIAGFDDRRLIHCTLETPTILTCSYADYIFKGAKVGGDTSTTNTTRKTSTPTPKTTTTLKRTTTGRATTTTLRTTTTSRKSATTPKTTTTLKKTTPRKLAAELVTVNSYALFKRLDLLAIISSTLLCFTSYV